MKSLLKTARKVTKKEIGMRHLILLSIFLGLVPPVEADIRSDCFNKWGDDYRMVEYCINQQNEAGAKLHRIPNDSMKANCLSKWGSDYRMVVYCYEQQSGALQRIGGRQVNYNKNNAKPTIKRSNDNCESFIVLEGKKTCL